MNKIEEDIDLIDFLFLLWNDKWFIAFFIFIASLIFSVDLFIKHKTKVNEGMIFKSEMKYKPNDILPIYYSKYQVISDFEELFFSKDLFNSWKNNNQQSSITIEELSKTQLSDGILFSKNQNNLMVLFVNSNNSENHFLRLITKKVSSFKEIYEYSSFINDVLTSKLVLYAENEHKMIVEKYRKYNSSHPDNPSTGYIHNLNTIDRYLDLFIDKGEKALIIEPPSLPNITNLPPKFSFFKFVIFLALGGIVGAFLSILKNAIYKRLNQA